MPGAIPDLYEIGPPVEGAALASLRVEMQRLLGRPNPAFPGICRPLFVSIILQ